MSESLPSLELVAAEVRAQRDELIRHLDALDAKAGIVLGSAGVVVAIAAQRLSAAHAGGLGFAVLSALAALSALLFQRFPAWDVIELQRYIVAEPIFTRKTMLDTTIRMARELKLTVDRKVALLRFAASLLGLAVVATAIGTIVT